MGQYREKIAVGRRDSIETILNPTAPQKASNQVQFGSPQLKTPATKAGSNQQQFKANDKGTGRENLPTAIALASKRKTNLKLPANF